jgi:hypothetical protein
MELGLSAQFECEEVADGVGEMRSSGEEKRFYGLVVCQITLSWPGIRREMRSQSAQGGGESV